MKKMMITALGMLMMAAPMYAQVYKDVDKTPKERLNTLLDDIKKGVKKTGESLNDLLGLENKADVEWVEIDGVKYMPVYTTDLFVPDSAGMYRACREDFAKRYENASVISVVIPQEDWKETVVTENKKVTMYKRTVYCYVLGKDGTDGYINARYAFRQLRMPGKKWRVPEGYWPKFEHADAIPNAHYRKLKKQ